MNYYGMSGFQVQCWNCCLMNGHSGYNMEIEWREKGKKPRRRTCVLSSSEHRLMGRRTWCGGRVRWACWSLGLYIQQRLTREALGPNRVRPGRGVLKDKAWWEEVRSLGMCFKRGVGNPARPPFSNTPAVRLASYSFQHDGCLSKHRNQPPLDLNPPNTWTKRYPLSL